MTTINVILANAKAPSFGSTTCEPMVYEVYCCYLLLSIMQRIVCKFIVMI